MAIQAWERIVVLKGAAGYVTLLGQQDVEGRWQFKKEIDPLLADLSSTITVTDSFKDGLALLGPSWKYLSPAYIHPDFKAVLWTYIKAEKGLYSLPAWRKACM